MAGLGSTVAVVAGTLPWPYLPNLPVAPQPKARSSFALSSTLLVSSLSPPKPTHTHRESLHLIAANSTAVGLPQPHLDRTRLCELGDEAFEPAYIAKREQLKALVLGLARPKVGGWVG